MTYMNLTTRPAGMYAVAAASTATILCNPNTTVAEIVAEVNTQPPYRGSGPCCSDIIICTRIVNGGPPAAGAQPAEFGCLHTDNAKGPPAIPAGTPAIGTLGSAGGPLVSGGGLLASEGGLWGGGCCRGGGCFSTRGFLGVGRAVGVGDYVGAEGGPYLGRRGAGVGDCVGAGTGRFLGV